MKENLEKIPHHDPLVRCKSCHGIRSGGSRTVLDDSGTLAITAWRCPGCGGVIEEIHLLSRYGNASRHRILHAVAP